MIIIILRKKLCYIMIDARMSLEQINGVDED